MEKQIQIIKLGETYNQLWELEYDPTAKAWVSWGSDTQPSFKGNANSFDEALEIATKKAKSYLGLLPTN